MKVIHVKTEKIISHKNDGTPIKEKTLQKLTESAFEKFVKYAPCQNYLTTQVIAILDVTNAGKQKELNEISQYQSIIDELKVDKNGKTSVELLNIEKKRNEDLAKRIKELECEYNKYSLDNIRAGLEAKANELNVAFRSSIGNTKLLEKINEIEPDFKI